MKKRIIVIVLLLLLLPAILFFSVRSLPKIYRESYYAELSDMTRRIDEAAGKRLILVGGSNIAFGIDVPLLEQYLREKGFEYTVCPYDLYAAVGTSAMLSLSESALREGDAVVLALEPASDALSTYFGATAFLKCAESDPALFLRLNRGQRTKAVGNVLPYIQEKYSILKSGQLPKVEGVYAKAAFDENCNMIYPREGNAMALGYDTSSLIALSTVTIEDDFAAQVNAYCKTAAKKGASVYMSFSPMNKNAVVGDAETGIAAYFTLCNQTFDCPVISNPLNYLLDSGWFYDSNFHLNTAGAKLRTYLLAQDLLAQWGCYTPIDVELPSMPVSIFAVAQDTADAGDFTFEEAANGQAYIVTGLTEQGRSKETLHIPAAYQGKPVAAIASDALTNAVNLVELHIPESVETLPDSCSLPARPCAAWCWRIPPPPAAFPPVAWTARKICKFWCPLPLTPGIGTATAARTTPGGRIWIRFTPIDAQAGFSALTKRAPRFPNGTARGVCFFLSCFSCQTANESTAKTRDAKCSAE